MSSSANQPGLCREKLGAELRPKPHEAEARRAEQVLHRAAGDDVRTQRPHVDLERADRLVAVGEKERAARVRQLRDRADVVAVARAEGHGRAAHERRPLVDRVREALEGDAAVGLGPDVDDLGAAKLLRVRDLPDGRELVLADDDPVPLAR